EAEVEYEDKTSPAIDVGFEVIATDLQTVQAAFNTSNTALPADARIMAVIWTTTPWTLPANQAICVHPDFDYELVQTEQGILILATELKQPCLERYGLTGQTLGRCKGAALEHLPLKHPFEDRLINIICGKHVTLEAGTGMVHTAPAHGLDDYFVGQQYQLPSESPVDGNGKFVADKPLVGGLFVWKANDVVIDALKNGNHLLCHQKIEHSYPHCWRHKTPIIFRSTPQWFIGMNLPHETDAPQSQRTLRELAMQAVDTTRFYPSWGRARLEAMIKNRPDWCVSRQRNWGVPIPFFLNKESGELHPRTVEMMEEVAKRVEVEGIEAWFKMDAAELLGDEAPLYDKISDTLDVWFDSGTTHWHVLRGSHPMGHETGPRADLYLEGSDQHRGWFHSSLLTGCAIDNHAPYRELLTHGFTVDEAGRKMSKSLGNVIAPQKVNDTLGADIMRLWVASTDYSGEIAVSDQILQRSADAYRRIRNTARFLLSNLSGFNPATDILPAEEMLALDRWAVDRALLLQRELELHYGEYRFWNVYSKVHNFCVQELGGFYLDIIKDRQYTTGANSKARRSCQTALFHISEALVRWIAPILSFTADELWQYLPGERNESVMLNTWYEGLSEMPEGTEMDRAYWERIMAVKVAVNKEMENLRAAKAIGGNLQAEVTLFAEDDLAADLSMLSNELRFVLITSTASVAPFVQAPADAVVTEVAGLKLKVVKSAHAKCARCWHCREDVGVNPEHPEICGRCVDNISGAGEVRHYA
ncbi:MAG: isoleucine--tRNA ligase, partial [Pseudomonadales bacterium]|nr:isoleucine--tRNA ligase [Pseudomonadales bacterium]